MGAIAPPSREKLPFLKEYKNKIFRLVLPHFNFWPAAEKCYYVSVLPVAKVIHNESFKNSICSIGMLCGVVWFRRVYLQKQPPEMFFKKDVFENSAKFTENTCALVFFLALLFSLCVGEIWLRWVHE